MGAVRSIAPQSDTRFSRKRALIIKAAAHTFGRKGFHATTLEEIAAALKVTKASLYYYFATKEELLYEVHLLSLGDVLRRVDGILSEERSPVTQLHEIVAEHLRVLASDYEGAFLLQQEYELPQKYREDIIRLRDEYEHKVLGVVQEGVRQRLFRVKDPRVVVRMMLGAVNWFLRWYRVDGRLTVDEIADAYIDCLFYGLLAPAMAPAAIYASSSVKRPAADGGSGRRKSGLRHIRKRRSPR
jgi:AcrR family transcriptional regulator